MQRDLHEYPLLQQLEQVATRRVNAAWWRAMSPPTACQQLMAKAFEENWDRASFDARVVLEYSRQMSVNKAVTDQTPGVPRDPV